MFDVIARNDTATLFSEGTASTLRLIVYLALAAILMVLDHRAGYLETLRRYSGAIVEPAYRIAAFPADGSYGVPEGLISSFPVTTKDGRWSIVQGLELDDFSRARIDASNAELAEERDAVKDLGLI